MKYAFLICFLFLASCKTTVPSESIASGVISDLHAHQQAISTLEKQTSKECKTDAFMNSLKTLQTQTDSIAGQVKSITQACKTEKVVLEQSITIREIIIGILIAIIAVFLFLRLKR